jgi:hypothetical protein
MVSFYHKVYVIAPREEVRLSAFRNFCIERYIETGRAKKSS